MSGRIIAFTGLLVGSLTLIHPNPARCNEIDDAFNIPSNEIGEADNSYVQSLLDSGVKIASECEECVTSGFLSVVDRSPSKQVMAIYVHEGQDWSLVYYGHVSTGKPGRREHFKTPTGAFPIHGNILGYRALGTFNENHIRGNGLKGMRVWDFGWQETQDWRSPSNTIKIRMEMHATDPANLEARIGRPDSEGCIRIHADLNTAMDRIGALDADTNRLAQNGSAAWKQILGPSHIYTPLAGNTLVVIDTSP